MKDIQAYDVQQNLKSISNSLIDKLRMQIRGEVLTPGDSNFVNSCQLWNAMIDKNPAFVVKCTGTADVVYAVRFAKEQNLLISVRGAGHNIAGRAISNNVMLIDLQDLRAVRVNPVAMNATISPGATLGDIDHETQLHGLALPVGINSTTGIAGLTLGGGFGWLSRRFGMTIDNLLSVEVVTTEGQLLECDETSHPELFWAVRGGGGNFGIITSFKFKLEQIGPEIMAGPVIFDSRDAKQVLNNYRKFCQSSPEDLSVWAVLRKAPPFPFIDESYHGKSVVIMACAYVGKKEDAQPLIEQIKQFANPIGDGFGPHLFSQFQAAFDPLLVPGARNYWKSHNFSKIDDALIDTLVEYASKLPSDESEIFLAQMGGATNRVDKLATAYPHRDVEYIMNVHTRWGKPEQDTQCIEWARDLYSATKNYASGGVYSNFVSEGDDSTEDAYAGNYERLSAIKAKYDPNNHLRCNLNITPK